MKGKIISQQIEIFKKDMKVAYWKDGICGPYGWVTGNLIGLPRMEANGEILSIIKWEANSMVHCQAPAVYLKQFMMTFESPEPMSEFLSLMSKYVRPTKDSRGNVLFSGCKIPLEDSFWDTAIKNNLVDTDVEVDFEIKDMAYYTNYPDMDTKPIAHLNHKIILR